eukprot:249466-Rhodomonas_salina.1
MSATCLRRRALSGAMSASSSCGRRWGSLCSCFPMRCVVEIRPWMLRDQNPGCDEIQTLDATFEPVASLPETLNPESRL